MRDVGKIQLQSATRKPAHFPAIIKALKDWEAGKFEARPDGAFQIRESGVSATIEKSEQSLGDLRYFQISYGEPVSFGTLSTKVRLLERQKALHFQCTLAAQSAGGLVPPKVDVWIPRFIRSIVDLGIPWQVTPDSERVFSKCFDVSQEHYQSLEDLILSESRKLPLVVVSSLNGRTIAGDIHEKISKYACGLAHTCRISESVAWQLTTKLGKEWSCYNGAIRLFWPLRKNRTDFRAHPLWTYDKILAEFDSQERARDIFSNFLRRVLVEASTFVVDDPVYSEFENERVRQAAELQRQAASSSNDYEGLANLYAKENDDLRALLRDRDAEISTLRSNVQALSYPTNQQDDAQDVGGQRNAPPISVVEAIQQARDQFATTLTFGEKIDEHAATLDASAGPPEKLYRYLETLNRLSIELGSNRALGRTIPIWLRENNVECSGESETVANNKEAKKRRTFKIDGKLQYCEWHAKPSDGVSPNLCVRIYFSIGAEGKRVKIGYIGRHFD